MRAAILSLILVVGLSAVSASRAQDAGTPDAHAQDKPPCDVPAYLLNSDSSLAKVAAAVKSGKPLNVLVVGSRSSTIPTQEGSAWPSQLQTTLKEKLGSVPVNLSVEIQAAKTAEDTAATLVKLVEAKGPTLVIWQTGTVDAIRGIDPDDFRGAVDEGVSALQKAGVDVVLVNLQYSPRTETMTSVPPYLDNMRVVAQQHDIPLFDRFAIMRHWNDSGDFDLFSATHGVELAKRVHACLGRALTKFVIDAAHLDQSQQN
jgi:lysophospholipase L1-like esterase